MVFEIGKTYSHPSGKKIKIQEQIDTMYHGRSLIAEDLQSGELIPVGDTEHHALNWTESSN